MGKVLEEVVQVVKYLSTSGKRSVRVELQLCLALFIGVLLAVCVLILLIRSW